MSDLDPAVMDQFYMKDGVSANDVTRVRFVLCFCSVVSFVLLLLDADPFTSNRMCHVSNLWTTVYGCTPTVFIYFL